MGTSQGNAGILACAFQPGMAELLGNSPITATTVNGYIQLNKTATGRYISGQLVRSATSGGANYEEACGAESRADFIHKLQIVFKGLKESRYWLRLAKKSKLDSGAQLEVLLREVEELTNIIAKSVITAKKNK